MRASDLITEFERMYEEHWAYEWGAAREGCVDCSGAFVYAFKKYGQSIYHGSNTIARKYIVGEMRPVSEAKPGWAVFKRRFDNGEPDAYIGDGLGNFYHMGLCSRDGTRALNAKSVSKGFCSDPIDGFPFAAPLKGVEYDEDDTSHEDAGNSDEGEQDSEPLDHLARVATANGPLRLRESPRTGTVLTNMPKGSILEVLGGGDWPKVRFAGLTGYASAEYLQRISCKG